MKNKSSDDFKSEVTVDVHRESLLLVGQIALEELADDGESSNVHRAAFHQLLERGAAIFPPAVWRDLETEVICHLRLAWGDWATEWLTSHA